MPTSAERDAPDVLLDTSAAVAFVLADHTGHESTFDALARRRLGLAGHAAFETFSVLTRLPPPARRTPMTVQRVLHENFPHTVYLGGDDARRLMQQLSARGVAGGSVYDALVGTVAKVRDLPLATRDRRALDTYRSLDVEVELIP